jgi:hypothetical protein
MRSASFSPCIAKVSSLLSAFLRRMFPGIGASLVIGLEFPALLSMFEMVLAIESWCLRHLECLAASVPIS